MKHLPFKLDSAGSFDLVVTSSGKMRTADYTTDKWLELGLGMRLELWFRLGFCQHPHAYSLPTVRPATPQAAFYPWPVVQRYATNG